MKPAARAKPRAAAWSLLVRDRRGKADMIEPSLIVIEPEKQRPDLVAVASVAKASDDTISRPEPVNLGDNAVRSAVASLAEPAFCDRKYKGESISLPGAIAALAKASSARLRRVRGCSSRRAPAGARSMSKRISRAGVCIDNSRIRLWAG